MCLFAWCRRAEPTPLQVHVTPGVGRELGGRIDLEGLDPADHVEWPPEDDDEHAPLALQNDRRTAVDVPPGTYELLVHHAVGAARRVRVTVPELPLPVVVGYDVEHASSDLARDGAVSARLHNAPADGAGFLWSNGVVTEAPSLRHVPPGRYVVALLGSAGERLRFAHVADVARVEARPRSDASPHG